MVIVSVEADLVVNADARNAATFTVLGQRRNIPGAALAAWMREAAAGGHSISQRLLATVLGGWG